MAFRKFAKASIIKPNIDLLGWDNVRQSAKAPQLRSAAKVVLQEYDPKAYMLTHCTIIASVNTEKNDAPLGKSMVDGFEIDRKYADWQISSDTTKYVNNNYDAWERKLLLACFRTFIGGENYVEHIQIPELSKGKIIDAAARDIGDSIYVDILVATDRKHRPLISAISGGSLQTLSMGCQVEFTICTKCGNVAYDETQLCNHIKYFKGNDFVDSLGQKRKIAELCGHIEEEPGSVKFIEASWVANPAFPGAVLRNILTPEEIANVGKKMSMAFSQPARTPDFGAIQKAASAELGIDGGSQRIAYLLGTAAFGEQDQGGGQEQGGGMGMGDAGTPKPEPSAIDKVVDDLVGELREKALAKLREEMGKGESSRAHLDENRNTTLIKEALTHPSWRGIARAVLGMTGGDLGIARRVFLGMVLYKSGGWGAVRAAKSLTGRDILAVARILDLTSKRRSTIAGENRLYRAILHVGGINRYPNEMAFLQACRQVVGRDLTPPEKEALVVRGRLFALGS